MPDYYYAIKGLARVQQTEWEKSQGIEGELFWKFPPLFSGMVTSPDKKTAKLLVDEEYGRVFPQRVLRKDMEDHPFLLSISEMSNDPTDVIRRRFLPSECKECGAVFRLIDRYNDPDSETSSRHHCSADCFQSGRERDYQEFTLVNQGMIPPVIYAIRQVSTGMHYVGQTIKPFTLRWWQHLTNVSDSKFHKAFKAAADMTDWEFKVLEVVTAPPAAVKMSTFLSNRERHWIDALDSVNNGLNTIRPAGASPQHDLDLGEVEREEVAEELF
jgi:hypothetical protein